MPRFLALINFTDEGIRDIGHSINRADEFRSEVDAAGGQVHSVYWALGEYDGVVIFEAPDDAVAAALLVKLAAGGHVRTHTLSLYDAAEFNEITAKM